MQFYFVYAATVSFISWYVAISQKNVWILIIIEVTEIEYLHWAECSNSKQNCMLRMLNEIQGKYVGQRYIKEEKRSNKEKESCNWKKSRWELNQWHKWYKLNVREN